MDHWQSDLDHLKWLDRLGVTNFAGQSVLDLGCGSGFLCEKMKNGGASRVVGVDLVKPPNAGNSGWQYLSTDLDHSDWATTLGHEPFDLIFAFDIIEHLQSPYLFLQNCWRLLSAGGQVVLTTPNVNSWERLSKPEDWSGVRDEQHKTLFNRYSLRFILERAGFELVQLSAPMRSLAFLGALQPHIGGQILALARKSGSDDG